MDDDLYLDEQIEDVTGDLPEFDEREPFWTTRRIVLTIIVIITLIAFLVYSLQGLFLPPPPPPPPTQIPPMI